MIILHLKDGNKIKAESKESKLLECNCRGLLCIHCPFQDCANLLENLTFGDAMKVREEAINNMVEYVEDTDDIVEEQEESKKKYTFEFTDEQALWLHAFMNMFNQDEISETLDVMDFFDVDNAPFYSRDYNKMRDMWISDVDTEEIEDILYKVSDEIYNKLSEQREFDE